MRFTDERVLFDGAGVPVAARSSYHGGREREVELVTRPLEVGERLGVLGPWLELARDQGFVPAHDGALHFHFDCEPWMHTGTLRSLVLGWTARRDELLRDWEPRQDNPLWRGPFSDELIEQVAASRDDAPFVELARAIRELDPPKTPDWNIRNVVSTRPRHPPLEARMWNAAVVLDRVETSFQATVAFLQSLRAP
ncbi:MAG: amidoligase family protein [Pseudomonadota bacterium]